MGLLNLFTTYNKTVKIIWYAKEDLEMDSLVIVDCQHDFIDGSLACGHGAEAVTRIIDFLNTHEVKALYTSDWHRRRTAVSK